MKKIIWIGLLLLTACATANPEPTSTPRPTATHIPPTEALVTVPPTSTPIPADTPTPPPPERYFTEEFESTLIYWTTLYAAGDSSGVDIRNENSALTFEVSIPYTWLYAIYTPFDYDRIHIETNVTSFGSDVNAMGLICHYSEQDGWYEFTISSDGNYSVLHGQWLTDGVARYTPIAYDISEYIQTGNVVNTIGMGCYDNFLRLYINNNPLRTLNVENIGLAGGKVGLSLASFDQTPLILSFDRVEVREP